MKRVRLFLIFIVLCISIGLVESSLAQSDVRVNVEDINSTDFPRIQAYVSVSDPQGFPISGLSAENFSIFEDGEQISDFEFEQIRNNDQTLAFVLAMDTSGSMAGTPIKDSVEAAKTFLSNLAPQDQVALVSFATEVTIDHEFTDDKDLIASTLDTLKAEGGTALYDSIVHAADLLKNRSERRVIIILTDGEDEGSQFDFNRVIDEVSRWSIPVFPIGFGDVNETELSQMAFLTGGFSQVQPDSQKLEEAFSNVQDALREQYEFKFTSGLHADNEEHDFKVALNYEDWHIENIHGFIATPRQIEIRFPDFNDGDTVGGKMQFFPRIIAPATVDIFDLSLDGGLVDRDFEEPWEIEWDATNITPGSHRLEFTASDTAGNIGNLTLNLNIQPPIEIEITTSLEEEKYKNVVLIEASITSLKELVEVKFLANDDELASFKTPPYQFEWQVPENTPRDQKITVSALDVKGNEIVTEVDIIVNAVVFDLWMVVVIGIVALALITIIPLSLRRRKRKIEEDRPFPRAMLRELEGHNPGEIWQLTGSKTTLGRLGRANDIHLKGTRSSRYHAEILVRENAHYIRPLNPENPVLINSEKAYQETLLEPGAVIEMGESKFRYEA